MKRAPLDVMRRNALMVLGTWLRNPSAADRHEEIRRAMMDVRDNESEPHVLRVAAERELRASEKVS
jgi:hypothetical protein